jgi:hypothetical protein
MRFSKILSRTLLYIFIAGLLILIAVSMKAISNLIAEEFLYKIIIIGDLFDILEVVEFVNVLVFAILGMGFGLATILLPKMARQQTSAVLLILLVPLIFSTNAIIEYNTWISAVADKQKISYPQAESLTNSFLNHRVGLEGFFGYYVYTAQFPVLPTSQDDIKGVEKLEQKVRSQFFSVNKLIGLKPEIISGLLATSRWMIRFFYFSLAVVATVRHFQEGCRELVKRVKPTAPYFPPVAPRFKPRPPTNKAVPQARPRKISSP